MTSTTVGRHARPHTPDRRRRTVAGAAALIVGASLLTAGPAFAAKGGGGGSTSSGSCTISPTSVAVGADYTLSASGLGANTLVNVLFNDSGSVKAWNLQADASGSLAFTTFSYHVGTTKATIQKNARHGFTTLATCSVTIT